MLKFIATLLFAQALLAAPVEVDGIAADYSENEHIQKHKEEPAGVGFAMTATAQALGEEVDFGHNVVETAQLVNNLEKQRPNQNEAIKTDSNSGLGTSN